MEVDTIMMYHPSWKPVFLLVYWHTVLECYVKCHTRDESYIQQHYRDAKIYNDYAIIIPFRDLRDVAKWWHRLVEVEEKFPICLSPPKCVFEYMKWTETDYIEWKLTHG